MNEKLNNDRTSCYADGESLILDATNEEMKNSDVVVIDSEVTDDNELGNSVGDVANEKGGNSSTAAIYSEHNELDSGVDYIEIEAPQEDHIKISKKIN